MNLHKKLILKLISPVTKVIGTKALIKLSGQKIFLPFYHSINNNAPKHLKYLYEVRNVSQFISDIDFILKHFKPISLIHLIDIVRNREIPKHPVCHLTFDDGLSEFNDIIAPLLLDKGIPATCFLNSAFIDNIDMMYRYKASLLIDSLHDGTKGSAMWKKYHEFCNEHNLGHEYYRKLLLLIDYSSKALLDELAIKLDISFKDYLASQKPYMTCDQIRSLVQKGFTFGAHSIDHPEYQFISEEEQLKQTRESINSITGQFNLDYKAFSFPFTDFNINNSFFNKVFDQKIADITFGCAGIKTDPVRFHLQRVPAEAYSYDLKDLYGNETLYYYMLKMLGKHKIKRA